MTDPLYTVENCQAAYQLNWSLAVFWLAQPPKVETWFDALQEATERDGVRILEHFLRERVSQFLLSTRPELTPPAIARSVKGRLQYLVRAELPRPFRRNYGLYSVGSANREAIEPYVGTQLSHHVMADSSIQAKLATLQIEQPIDLRQPRISGHAQFNYNLHVVLVNAEHLADVREEVLEARRARLLAAAAKKGHLISRGGILTDHLHLSVGCGLTEAPQEVALSYLNNLAHVEGMRPVYEYGYYVGMFGEYDLNAIRQRLASGSVS